MADPNLYRRAYAQTAHAISNQWSVAADRMVRQGIREAGTAVEFAIQERGRALDLRLIPRSRLKAANLLIANEAQEAMVAGWRRRLPRQSSSYRSQSRLTKTLGRALKSESMTAFTTDRRISFINQTTLSNEAKHWYRVNYGAVGPNLSEGKQPVQFVGAVRGQPIFPLRDDTPPAAQNWLPRTFSWRGGNFPKGLLFPGKNSAPADVPGHGIRAARFTDLGLEVVARRTGEVYFVMIQEYAATTAGAIKFAEHGIKIEGDLRTTRFGQT